MTINFLVWLWRYWLWALWKHPVILNNNIFAVRYSFFHLKDCYKFEIIRIGKINSFIFYMFFDITSIQGFPPDCWSVVSYRNKLLNYLKNRRIMLIEIDFFYIISKLDIVDWRYFSRRIHKAARWKYFSQRIY